MLVWPEGPGPAPDRAIVRGARLQLSGGEELLGARDISTKMFGCESTSWEEGSRGHLASTT